MAARASQMARARAEAGKTMGDSLYGFLSFLYEPLFMRRAAVALFLLSIASGGTGVLVVSRRMAFFPDAAGHTIFGGLALGLIFSLPIDATVLVFGVLIGLTIIYLLRHSDLASDTVIGLVFSGGVALGLALASRYPSSQSNLTRYLLGDVLTVDERGLLLLLILAILSVVFFAVFYNRLMLSSIAPANYGGDAVSEYLFGGFMAVVVVIAVQAVGVLLVTALLIAPAAAGRMLARSGRGMFWTAMAISVVSGQAGLFLANRPSIDTTPGATVVFISIGFCALAVALKKARGAFKKFF